MSPAARPHEFDYLILGAGSAGCVLANRLSADPAVRVLVLEAGPADRHPLLHIPLGVGRLYDRGLFDWGLATEPEPGLAGRSLEATRGKVLGGSSSVNMMAFTRGHRGDYDRWAHNGARGWSHAEVLPYFKRVESWSHGPDPQRGADGPIGVEFGRFDDPLSDAWLAAATECGHACLADYNGAEQAGFGRGQYSIRGGRRSSAAVGFLRPALGRPNLRVITGALVHRVLIEADRASGVEYSRGQTHFQARCTREVIVCAGSYNSPQLLMLSGIGPAAHLESLGIAVKRDLPVGRNLQEHLAVRVFWTRRTPGPFRHHMRADRMVLAMLRAHLFGTGVATTHPSALHAFLRSSPAAEVPDIELIFRYAPQRAHLWFPGVRAPYADGYGVVPVLLHPKSRGEVSLRSARPQDPVRIRLNAFAEPADLATLRRGVELARELGNAAALAPHRGAEIAPGPAMTSPHAIDEWIRRSAVLVHHPAGTCAIGPVLDPALRVHGIDGLRVVDASAMPDLVSAHINACVMMMAEKAADQIRR